MKKLPFYDNVELIRINPDKWSDDPSYFFFARSGDNLTEFGGLSEHIYEVNDYGGLQLNAETYAEYLKFYCMFLLAEDEDGEAFDAFYIIEGAESEYLDEKSPFEKDKILKNYEGLSIEGPNSRGVVIAKARLFHFGALYDAIFEISDDGTIVMSDDTYIGSP